MPESVDVFDGQNAEKYEAREEREHLPMEQLVMRSQLWISNLLREISAIRRHALQQISQPRYEAQYHVSTSSEHDCAPVPRRLVLAERNCRNYCHVSDFEVHNEAAAIRGHIHGQQQMRDCTAVSLLTVQEGTALIRRHVQQRQPQLFRNHSDVSILTVHDGAATIRRYILPQQQMRNFPQDVSTLRIQVSIQDQVNKTKTSTEKRAWLSCVT
ncbi:unnamed protein product [Pocillopora meandrina]|uniref:Uncharacterized protein n=1 Tax=Pocillopora meandrina TaxID=46732 RepID=A0AAU9VRB3_9CNID|nr:unnamed protein product [Pocillopora meandrina]